MTTPQARLAALEERASHPEKVRIEDFNPNCKIPFGVRPEHLHATMNEFVDFIGFLGQQLHGRQLVRLESMLMPANFSSMVGEFISATLPKHCPTVVKNNYHNGHPDLVPKGMFKGDTIQHADQGIEVKGSRYLKGWQGHNAEDTWLMVFCYDSNRPVDASEGTDPKPFRYLYVCGAELKQSDWTFSGRSETSRRTITAGINASGFAKMSANWIYKAPGLRIR